MPAFCRSAIDGYAVPEGSEPGLFRVIGEVRPGMKPFLAPEAGEAVKVFTGSALPESGIGLVMVEDTESEAGRVLTRAAATRRHLRLRGSQAKRGDVLLPAGAIVNPGTVALLASVGVTEPLVSPEVRAAHLVTGSELVPANSEPPLWLYPRQQLSSGGRPARGSGCEPDVSSPCLRKRRGGRGGPGKCGRRFVVDQRRRKRRRLRRNNGNPEAIGLRRSLFEGQEPSREASDFCDAGCQRGLWFSGQSAVALCVFPSLCPAGDRRDVRPLPRRTMFVRSKESHRSPIRGKHGGPPRFGRRRRNSWPRPFRGRIPRT